MNTSRKIFLDPALYILILLNLFFIFEYKDDPTKYNTIVWVFWIQSVLIGLFTFFELISTKMNEDTTITLNDKPVSPKQGKSCYSFFFLFHYQAFHFAYFIFLIVSIGLRTVDGSLLKYAVVALLFSQLVTFIRHKQAYSQHPPNLGMLFFTPYLRIVPMHMMILLPEFLNIKPSLVFLVLKAVFDVLGHLITTRYYWRAAGAKTIETI